ncbi:glycosyltransferase, partial [bacterium]|nr:glycosyltransferase [bacterium]
VLSQNYPNIEYIIIDGGSTDNSVEIIKKYEKYLSCWVSEKDDGQTAAINKGLMKATGDIIAYINSDDVYLPDAFNHIVEMLSKQPTWGMVYGDYYLIDESSKVIKKKREIDFDYVMGCFIGMGIIIPQPTVFFTRSVFEKVGHFDESYNYSMDSDYWFRVAQTTKIKHIPKFIASFRLHKQSKTNIHHQEITKLYAEESLRVIQRAYQALYISKVVPFRYSFILRKGYRIKRIVSKMINGYYFG